MDDWNRKIVRPLALHAFRRKIKEHRASYELLGSLDDAEIALWTRYGALGERLLEHYFAWCATVDDFESGLLSDHELRAPVPDPSVAGRDLVAPDGRDFATSLHNCRLRRSAGRGDIEPCLEARSSMEEIGRVIARDALATTASDPRRYRIIHRTTARGARTASRVARRMPGSTSGRSSRRAAAASGATRI